MNTGLVDDTRGVQWTLEAFLAVLLLLASLVVVVAVLPVGTQQVSVEVEQAQLQQNGDDVLRLAEADGLLRETLLYWNTSNTRFVDSEAAVAGEAHYTSLAEAPDHPIRPLLDETLDERRLSYNIHIEPGLHGGNGSRRPLVYQGPPGGNSVVASTTVLLQDGDSPVESSSNCTLGELGAGACSDEQFYTNDTEPGTDRYAVVEVRIELWQG